MQQILKEECPCWYEHHENLCQGCHGDEGSAGVRAGQTTRSGAAYLQVGAADSEGPTMSSPSFL